MGTHRKHGPKPSHLGILVVALALGWGCATTPPRAAPYAYFATPQENDAWGPKIRTWQARERAGRGTTVPVNAEGEERTEGGPSGDLEEKYDAFRTERKRALARDIAGWIQRQSKEHYVPDGPIDHWATLRETFSSNGDDCDGLELLTYHFLRDLGFPANEVYRAIVFRRSDGQHHMVTLWFEDPDDPWVIDPTGAMTTGMPRMSGVPEWVPIKIFSEDEYYTVRTNPVLHASKH